MSDAFYKVSWVRRDGGAHELCLIGFGAKGLACRHYRELELSKHVSYVAMIQRHVDPAARTGGVTWEIVSHHLKPKELV